MFENYCNEYKELSNAKKDNLDQKFKPINLKRKYLNVNTISFVSAQ